MKHLILIFLFFGIATLYIGCSDSTPSGPNLNQNDQVTATLDKKPAAHLVGDLELWWSPGWVGTVTFEDGSVYGIKFNHLGGDWPEIGQAYHFFEEYIIYDLADETNVLMKGPDEGVGSIRKYPEPIKYVINGKVSEAYGVFVDQLGRNLHINGVINWDVATGAPLTAPGTLRIN
ncbi:MAG: hypothetical protein P8X73_02875 [Ignavibacteriaceae bacterium]